MKYIFKQIDNISGLDAITTVEFNADSLSDILEHFQYFLKGSGYMIDGYLDVVPPDEPVDWPNDYSEDEPPEMPDDGVQHSEYFYDTERNK